MSSMLEQAILDAKELKEAAIKNAQQSIIEKYSNEFEGEIEKLLEQAAVPPATPIPATPGAAPVDPEKAKADSDNKSSMFEKLNYAFKDGEIIEDKIFSTGLVEIDLDSLSEFSFENNNKTAEQMALQELKKLSLKERIEEEMNDDEDFDEESDTYPYESEEDEDDFEDEDDMDLDDEEFEDEDELEMDDEGFEDDDLEDEESDMDVDIEDEEFTDDEDMEDEEFTDDEDMEDEDLYGTEDDVGFHVDYDMGDEEDESEEDYDPDADVEDFEDEESEEDMEDEEESDDEEDSEEDEEDEEYYYDDEEDSEEDEEDLEESEESKKESPEQKAVEIVEELINQIEKALNVLDTKKHPGLEERLKKMLRTAKGKKEQLQEAIKLDWKRSGQRSPFTGMFKEEAEHDYMLEQVQEQIESLEQEVEELQESNKKLRSGLKESINLVENLTNKVKKYEQKLHESRLLNYKLLYTNKALSDSSLNGQQKNKIAESIDGAKTAEEVKLLYETLKSTMRDGTSRSTPKSLSEAVERRSSSLLLRGSRAEPKKQDDFAERMKRLAGL